ncbi:hypothetical protein NDU88_002042 [Pleurodeles waltl]|uniref:Uncharacterized protein n=1 Tax=Pleurodeles waltl TaxID=8319 RepID=A0AAV7V9E7_PLEWA|nr:hypothetical protein NDU88_002042 [Pleurodeles waltl]
MGTPSASTTLVEGTLEEKQNALWNLKSPPLDGAERESGRNSCDVKLECPGTAQAGNKRTLLRQQKKKKTLRRRVETRYRTGMLRGDSQQKRNGSPVGRALGNALTGRGAFEWNARRRALHT